MPTFANDVCLSFFAECYAAGMFEFPQGARVLEIGCAEADWSGPMKQARPDLQITSIDVRRCERPGSDLLIRGDVLAQDFPPGSFDAIVSVSTIEHIGLGGYGDPVDADGDTKTMAACRRWLTPTGWLYFDVPYAEAYEVRKKWRRYDEAALQARLLTGWKEMARRVFTVDHPDSPYVALTVTPA